MWVYGAEGVVVEVVFLEGVGEVVFDKDVAGFGKVVQNVDSFGVGE